MAASEGTVLLAQPRGFCAGVSYAIEIVRLVLERYGPPVYVRHEIVHNRHVVDSLRQQGAHFIEDLDEVPPGSLLIFSAHGVSPAVRQAARQRRLRAIDATCPLVTKVHLQVLRYAREDFEIVMVGHRGHVEVEGTMGHAPERMYLVQSVEEAQELHVRRPDRLAVVTQTTLSVDDTREIVAVLQERFPGLRTPPKDDICYATQNRQSAVKAIAARSDLVLVIGSPSSSNANRLVEVACRQGTAARLIESPASIDPSWLTGCRTVGLSAGASTPEVLVRESLDTLARFGFSRVETVTTAEESVHFPLPRALRKAGASVPAH